MKLTEWMLKHLPAEVVDECNYYGLSEHLRARLETAWQEGYTVGYASPDMEADHNPRYMNPYREDFELDFPRGIG